MTVLHRRALLKLSGCALGTIAAPSLIRAQTKSSAPIKIGFTAPLSGPIAGAGQEIAKGFELYLDSIGRKVGTRSIEGLVQDETAQVNTAVSAARKLIESDGVNALIGGLITPVIYATVPLAMKARIPYLALGGGAEISRKSKRNPFTFRTTYNIWALTYPFARWLPSQGIKKVHIFSPDYVAGKEFTEAFKAGFVPAGGEITGETYTPLSTVDFVPVLTTVAEAKPEAIFGYWPSGPAIRFLTTADQIGLNKKSKLLLTGFAADHDTLSETGKALVGSLSIHCWNDKLPNTATKQFVSSYQKSNKDALPSFLNLFGWDSAQAIVTAAGKVGGDVEDKDKFAAAFNALSFDSPRGRITIDAETHDIVQDIFVKEGVAKGSNGVDFKVAATLPDARDPMADKG